MTTVRPHSLFAGVLAASAIALLVTGCSRKEAPDHPVARPSVTLSHDKAPLGSPIEITYRFAVAENAKFDGAYRVMLHVLDVNEELIWTDDHEPPVPTTEWKAGQIVEYTRTVFIPVYPYIGEASLQVGLYSPTTQKRLPLEAEDTGQRAYRAGRLALQPQSANVFTVFKDGWHPAESAAGNALVEWQWTKKQATLAFKNPKKDSNFYLDLDNPGGPWNEPQQVRVSLGAQAIEEFQVIPAHRIMKKIPVAAGQFGAADIAEIEISVDKTFVPSVLTNGESKDPRVLGVRVFHAFIAPEN